VVKEQRKREKKNQNLKKGGGAGISKNEGYFGPIMNKMVNS
jgi:hypothetical protein